MSLDNAFPKKPASLGTGAVTQNKQEPTLTAIDPNEFLEITKESFISKYGKAAEKLLEKTRQEAVEENKADTERLDFLDKCNQALNKQYGTDYGWELIINQNITRLMIKGLGDIDLNDARGGNDKLSSCRDAIDKKIKALSLKKEQE